MKTISTAYYEKMAEAKQTFCAFCMRGAMPFLEDCKDCKINRMFKAVQAVIKEETTPQDEAAVEKTRNAYDGIDLPKEMIESLGRGPRNHDGFRTSPAFQLFITNGAYPDVEVQLIESKTGFPDFSVSEEETSSRSTVHYLNYLEKGVGVPSSIQLWDLTYDTLKDELKSLLGADVQQEHPSVLGDSGAPIPGAVFYHKSVCRGTGRRYDERGGGLSGFGRGRIWLCVQPGTLCRLPQKQQYHTTWTEHKRRGLHEARQVPTEKFRKILHRDPVYDFSDVHRHPARQRQGRGQHYQKNL